MKSAYWLGNKIKLRAPSKEDIHIFDTLDHDILKNLNSISFPRTRIQIQEWIDTISKTPLNESDDFYFIAEDENENVIGTIETFDCDIKNGTFSYALSVFPSYRGKGFSKDMILTVLRYYFFELRYQKATICVYSFNNESITLHKNLNFVEEGRLRNMIYTNDSYFDEIYFGMTKEEFKCFYQVPT